MIKAYQIVRLLNLLKSLNVLTIEKVDANELVGSA